MLIYAVDDERLMLAALVSAIREAVPSAAVQAYRETDALLEALEKGGEVPDVIFLDIEMPGLSGIELAKRIKAGCPKTNLVFATGFSEYALEALTLHASGYMMKPVTKEKVLTELANLRCPPQTDVPEKRIRVQCFGAFEIFADNVPIPFSRSKSKELLAYLVDRRGAACSATQIAAVIWDDGIYDRSRQKQFSTLRAEMLKALRKVGAAHILSVSHDALAVLPQSFDCDYYAALAGDMVCLNAYIGEYMADYSWAEFTASSIREKLPRLQAL